MAAMSQPFSVIGNSILRRKTLRLRLSVRAIGATAASISTHLAEPHLAAVGWAGAGHAGSGALSYDELLEEVAACAYDAAAKRALVGLGTFATPEEELRRFEGAPVIVSFPTTATAHLLRKPPRKIILVCSGSSSRSYGSYTKTKSGVLVPTSFTAKASRFDDFKSFVKNQWQTADPKSKNIILELLGKGLLLAMSGGGVATLLATLSVRMDNLEDKVDESVKELKIEAADLKAQVAQQSKSSHQHEYESHTRYQKLQAEVNEMRGLKDIWLANWFKSSGGVTGPVVATEEGTLSRR